MIKKKTVNNILLIITAVLAIAAVIYFIPDILSFLWLLLCIFLPFFIAYAVSLFTNGFADALQKRFKLPRSISAVIVIILIFGVIGGIVTGVIWKIVDELKRFYDNFPSFYANMQASWNRLSENMSDIADALPENVRASMDSVYNQFMDGFAAFVRNTEIFKTAGNIAKKLPNILISVITFILSLYFMISDSERVDGFIRSHIPERIKKHASQFKKEIKRYVGGYLRAQLIMMCISFTIILIGFLILKIDYALVLALAIALFDALPFFGSGAVLIPWSLIGFFSGNAPLGVGLLIIYLSALLMRQMIEPKIVGQSIGMHPLLTLMSMYAGYRIFSVGGLILGPLGLMLIISFYKIGLFDGVIAFTRAVRKKTAVEIRKFIDSFNSDGE